MGRPPKLIRQISEESVAEKRVGRPPAEATIPISTLIEYAKKGMTHLEIARVCGVSENNVQRRLAKADFKDLKRFEENKAIVLSMKQREIMDALTEEKMAEASALQLGTLFGILNDKQRVIQGQATSIVEHREISLNLAEAVKNLQSMGLMSEDVIDIEALEAENEK